MVEYEITYLSDPQLTDEARAELDGAVETAVSERQGSVAQSTPGGRRRLFYPIRKQSSGVARSLNISLDPAQVQSLRETLQKQVGVMRFMILKTGQRESATMALFDSMMKPAAVPAKAKVAERASTKPVTMAEVEEGIEEALEEEVK